jgi:ech hydrogenase subunit D
MSEESDEKTRMVVGPVIEGIAVESLLGRAAALKKEGWRLVQVLGVSTKEAIELSYAFGLDDAMAVLRFLALPGTQVPSITSVYAGAYLYENELRDLFGVDIRGISVDWLGKVYDIKGTNPFSKIRVEMPSSEGGSR